MPSDLSLKAKHSGRNRFWTVTFTWAHESLFKSVTLFEMMGHAMVHAVSRRPLVAVPLVRAWFSVCGICGERSGTGTGFSPILWFSFSLLFHRDSPYSCNICWMNNMPLDGRISETYSHPIDMNLKNMFVILYRKDMSKQCQKAACNYVHILI
jgi:hypothetical protein